MSVRIEARRGEPLDKLLQRFKRAIVKDGVLKEIKERSTYEKPSERKRRKRKERAKTLRKVERKRKEGGGNVWKKEERTRD